jgi:pyridoxamine 5'-phosphate oxidase
MKKLAPRIELPAEILKRARLPIERMLEISARGTVDKLPREASEAYFKSASARQPAGAWASNQYDVVADRAALDEEVERDGGAISGADVPLPPNWGGFVLKPELD